MKVKMTSAVHANFRVTRKTLNHLMDCASSHYDGECKRAAKPGGFLHGWAVRMGDTRSAEVRCSGNTLDLICKILESPKASPKIWMTFKLLFATQRKVQEESLTLEVNL